MEQDRKSLKRLSERHRAEEEVTKLFSIALTKGLVSLRRHVKQIAAIVRQYGLGSFIASDKILPRLKAIALSEDGEVRSSVSDIIASVSLKEPFISTDIDIWNFIHSCLLIESPSLHHHVFEATAELSKFEKSMQPAFERKIPQKIIHLMGKKDDLLWYFGTLTMERISNFENYRALLVEWGLISKLLPIARFGDQVAPYGWLTVPFIPGKDNIRSVKTQISSLQTLKNVMDIEEACDDLVKQWGLVLLTRIAECRFDAGRTLAFEIMLKVSRVPHMREHYVQAGVIQLLSATVRNSKARNKKHGIAAIGCIRHLSEDITCQNALLEEDIHETLLKVGMKNVTELKSSQSKEIDIRDESSATLTGDVIVGLAASLTNIVLEPSNLELVLSKGVENVFIGLISKLPRKEENVRSWHLEALTSCFRAMKVLTREESIRLSCVKDIRFWIEACRYAWQLGKKVREVSLLSGDETDKKTQIENQGMPGKSDHETPSEETDAENIMVMAMHILANLCLEDNFAIELYHSSTSFAMVTESIQLEDERMQEYACRVLSSFMVVEKDAHEVIANERVLVYIIRSVRSRRVATAIEASRALANLSQNEKIQKSIAETNTFSSLFRISNFLREEEFDYEVMLALRNYSIEDTNKRGIFLEGGLPWLLNCLKTYRRSNEMVIHTLSVMFNVLCLAENTEQVFSEDQEFRLCVMNAFEYLAAVCEAADVAEDFEVIRLFAAIIGNMALVPKNAELISQDVRVISLLLTFITRHKHRLVQHQCLKALANLLRCQSGRERSMIHGAVGTLLSISKWGNEMLTHVSFTCLSNLCLSAPIRFEVARHGGAKLLVQAISTRWDTRDDVFTEALIVLRNFVESTEVHSQAARAGLMSLLQKMLSSFKEMNIQDVIHVLSITANMSLSHSYVPTLVEMGLIERAFAILAEFPISRDILGASSDPIDHKTPDQSSYFDLVSDIQFHFNRFLKNCSRNSAAIEIMMKYDAIQCGFSFMSPDARPDVQRTATQWINTLMQRDTLREMIFSNDTYFHLIVSLLQSRHESIVHEAAVSLSLCAVHLHAVDPIARLGGWDLIQQLCQAESFEIAREAQKSLSLMQRTVKGNADSVASSVASLWALSHSGDPYLESNANERLKQIPNEEHSSGSIRVVWHLLLNGCFQDIQIAAGETLMKLLRNDRKETKLVEKTLNEIVVMKHLVSAAKRGDDKLRSLILSCLLHLITISQLGMEKHLHKQKYLDNISLMCFDDEWETSIGVAFQILERSIQYDSQLLKRHLPTINRLMKKEFRLRKYIISSPADMISEPNDDENDDEQLISAHCAKIIRSFFEQSSSDLLIKFADEWNGISFVLSHALHPDPETRLEMMICFRYSITKEETRSQTISKGGIHVLDQLCVDDEYHLPDVLDILMSILSDPMTARHAGSEKQLIRRLLESSQDNAWEALERFSQHQSSIPTILSIENGIFDQLSMNEKTSDVIQVKFLNILGNVLQIGGEIELRPIFEGKLCNNILKRMCRKDYPTHTAMQIAARVFAMFFETESARKVIIPNNFQTLLESISNLDLHDRVTRPFLRPILHRCIHEWKDVAHLIIIDRSFFTVITKMLDKSIETSDEDLLQDTFSLMFEVSHIQVFRKMIMNLPLFDRIMQSKEFPPDLCVDIAVSLCRDDFIIMELAKGDRFEKFVNAFLLERIDGEMSRLENERVRKTSEKVLKSLRRVIHRKTWKDHVLDIPGLVYHLVVFCGTPHEYELIYLLSASIMMQMMSEDRAQLMFSNQSQSTVGVANLLDRILKICRKPLESWAEYESDKYFISHVQQEVLFGIASWAMNDRTIFSLIHKWEEEELLFSLMESTSWTRESRGRKKAFAKNRSLSVASISGFSDVSSEETRSEFATEEHVDEKQEFVLERFTELLQQNIRHERVAYDDE